MRFVPPSDLPGADQHRSTPGPIFHSGRLALYVLVAAVVMYLALTPISH